jgi:hypothetical protein
VREIAGYLLKQGKKVKNWKRRWFVFRKDLSFSYFKNFGDKTPIKTINLANDDGLEFKSDISQGEHFTFKVVTKQRTFYFSCSNDTDKDQWLLKLRKWVESNTYFLKSKNATPTTPAATSYEDDEYYDDDDE